MGDTTLCGKQIYTIRADTDTGFRIANTIDTIVENYVRKEDCPLCQAVLSGMAEAITAPSLQDANKTNKPSKPKFGGYISKDVYIIKAIANAPAFIVFWSDGTKTTAKCSMADKWDAEKGLAICVLKKLQGNTWVQQLFADWAIDDGSWTLNELRQMHRYFNKHGK